MFFKNIDVSWTSFWVIKIYTKDNSSWKVERFLHKKNNIRTIVQLYQMFFYTQVIIENYNILIEL